MAILQPACLLTASPLFVLVTFYNPPIPLDSGNYQIHSAEEFPSAEDLKLFTLIRVWPIGEDE